MKRAPKLSKEIVKRTLFDLLAACFERREVHSHEVDLVLPTYRNKWLRPQIEAKLQQLNLNDPIHRELYHLVRLSLELFEAVNAGKYRPGKDWPEIEPRLKRALAYFVKTGDAIPDHETYRLRRRSSGVPRPGAKGGVAAGSFRGPSPPELLSLWRSGDVLHSGNRFGISSLFWPETSVELPRMLR